jgi:radical SAM superfamily enzyme YgiQ (UPF0313 family)
MKVALVKCPWWVRYCPPYILAFMATYLRNHGHDVSCFDLNNTLYHAAGPEHKKYWEDRDLYSFWENESFVKKLLSQSGFDAWIDRILASGAQVICFDTHTPSVIASIAAAKRIKEKDAGRIIIFLGHKASRAQMADDFIRERWVDYVCPGEADKALVVLLGKLEGYVAGDPLPEQRGFLSKRGNEIVDSGDPEVEKDLDLLPFPDYADFKDDIENGNYSQPWRLDILDSRGCINACHFCYERLFWGSYRAMSGKRIFEQIVFHKKMFPQINYFYFNGLLLNGKLENLEEFCDLIIEQRLAVRWAGQAVVREDMTKPILMKMRAAGCETLGYGVESGSQKVLDSMNKRFSIAKAAQVLKDTHAAGINFQVNIMFGFPTETVEDFKKTLDFLVDVRPSIESILASQSFFTLEKGTYIYNNPEKFGIVGEKHYLFWKSDEGNNNYAERFRRYEEFCRLAISLGIPETSGVLAVKPDKWFLLGQYYRFEKEYRQAANCFMRSLEQESRNDTTMALLNECLAKVKDNE